MTKTIKNREEALAEACNIVEELVETDEYGRFHEPNFKLNSYSAYSDNPAHWTLNFKFTDWTFTEKDQLSNLLEFLENLEQPTQLYMTQDKPLSFSVSYKKEGEEVESSDD